MGTTTFMLEFGTTLSALVAVMGMTLVAAEGEDEIGNEQQIAYVIEGGDAEDHIDNGTDGGKAGEVEQRIEGGQLMAHIIENSHSNEDDSPDRGDKESEVERKGKGVQRGMEIVVAPRLGSKHLDGGVEGS
jgi:hypothetical protein